jgi:hypothetical protein
MSQTKIAYLVNQNKIASNIKDTTENKDLAFDQMLETSL